MYILKNIFMFCLHLDLERQTYNFFDFILQFSFFRPFFPWYFSLQLITLIFQNLLLISSSVEWDCICSLFPYHYSCFYISYSYLYCAFLHVCWVFSWQTLQFLLPASLNFHTGSQGRISSVFLRIFVFRARKTSVNHICGCGRWTPWAYLAISWW